MMISFCAILVSCTVFFLWTPIVLAISTDDLVAYLNTLRNDTKEINLDNRGLDILLPNTFEKFYDLRSLSLDFNKLRSLPDGVFNGLTKLNHLTLIKNEIVQISPLAFEPLVSLTWLDLNSNLIQDIDPITFSTLKRLETLFLFSNSITTLADNVFKSNTNLRDLFLKGNPWNCCSTQWIKEAVEKMIFQVRESDLMKCVSPGNALQNTVLNLDYNVITAQCERTANCGLRPFKQGAMVECTGKSFNDICTYKCRDPFSGPTEKISCRISSVWESLSEDTCIDPSHSKSSYSLSFERLTIPIYSNHNITVQRKGGLNGTVIVPLVVTSENAVHGRDFLIKNLNLPEPPSGIIFVSRSAGLVLSTDENLRDINLNMWSSIPRQTFNFRRLGQIRINNVALPGGGSGSAVRALTGDPRAPRCLTVNSPELRKGAPVILMECNGEDNDVNQIWNLPEPGVTGQVTLGTSTFFCLTTEGLATDMRATLVVIECDNRPQQDWVIYESETFIQAAFPVNVDEVEFDIIPLAPSPSSLRRTFALEMGTPAVIGHGTHMASLSLVNSVFVTIPPFGDPSGVFEFDPAIVLADSSQSIEIELNIVRYTNFMGFVEIFWITRSDTALPGVHYEHAEGSVVFKDDETGVKTITLRLILNIRTQQNENSPRFFVDIIKVVGKEPDTASVGEKSTVSVILPVNERTINLYSSLDPERTELCEVLQIIQHPLDTVEQVVVTSWILNAHILLKRNPPPLLTDVAEQVCFVNILDRLLTGNNTSLVSEASLSDETINFAKLVTAFADMNAITQICTEDTPVRWIKSNIQIIVKRVAEPNSMLLNDFNDQISELSSFQLPEDIEDRIGNCAALTYIVYSNGIFFPLNPRPDRMHIYSDIVINVGFPEHRGSHALKNLTNDIKYFIKAPEGTLNKVGDFDGAVVRCTSFNFVEDVEDEDSTPASKSMFIDDGCHGNVTAEGVNCRCNHLTDFAVIIDYGPPPKPLSRISFQDASGNWIFLSNAVVIAASIVVCLLVMSISPLRKDRTARMFVFLSIALAVGSVLFVIDISISSDTSPLGCFVLGLFVHYFILATHVWLVLLGVHLYYNAASTMLTELRKSHIYRFLGGGFGVPAIGVGIYLGVSFAIGLEYWQVYGDVYGDGDICFIKEGWQLIASVIIPAIICYASYFMWFYHSLRTLFRCNSRKRQGVRMLFRNDAVMYVVFATLFMLSWLFCILFIDKRDNAFLIFFCILHVAQSIVFVFINCWNDRTKNAWISRYGTEDDTKPTWEMAQENAIDLNAYGVYSATDFRNKSTEGPYAASYLFDDYDDYFSSSGSSSDVCSSQYTLSLNNSTRDQMNAARPPLLHIQPLVNININNQQKKGSPGQLPEMRQLVSVAPYLNRTASISSLRSGSNFSVDVISDASGDRYFNRNNSQKARYSSNKWGSRHSLSSFSEVQKPIRTDRSARSQDYLSQYTMELPSSQYRNSSNYSYSNETANNPSYDADLLKSEQALASNPPIDSSVIERFSRARMSRRATLQGRDNVINDDIFVSVVSLDNSDIATTEINPDSVISSEDDIISIDFYGQSIISDDDDIEKNEDTVSQSVSFIEVEY